MSLLTTSFFSEIAHDFVKASLPCVGAAHLENLGSLMDALPVPLAPLVLGDCQSLTTSELHALRAAFFGRHGVAYFVVTKPLSAQGSHPLLDIASQLSDEIPTKYPVSHPGEDDSEAVSIVGKSDGTLKVFVRDSGTDSTSNVELHMHQDGVGRAGTVVTSGLYCDTGPVWGGFTCFQNGLRLALELAKVDWPAFESLFYPRTLTLVRTGRNSIKITGPVLYFGDSREPQIFLRANSGTYSMTWASAEPVQRARAFLLQFLRPFALGSSFVSLYLRGHGCLFRNQATLHGRTRFINGQSADTQRLLSRKWFASGREYSGDMRVPGFTGAWKNSSEHVVGILP
jgi:Taurine catabolism dioxygenase TauD, TfdA family